MNASVCNTVVALAVCSCAVSVLRADFAEDFQTATKRFDEKKYTEALESFKQLAAAAPQTRARAESMSMAARALGHLGQYEKALDMARSISEIGRAHV